VVSDFDHYMLLSVMVAPGDCPAFAQDPGEMSAGICRAHNRRAVAMDERF
jgi:hypothetical protein